MEQKLIEGQDVLVFLDLEIVWCCFEMVEVVVDCCDCVVD